MASQPLIKKIRNKIGEAWVCERPVTGDELRQWMLSENRELLPGSMVLLYREEERLVDTGDPVTYPPIGVKRDKTRYWKPVLVGDLTSDGILGGGVEELEQGDPAWLVSQVYTGMVNAVCQMKNALLGGRKDAEARIQL